MLTALILVCSLAITPELRNCDRNNALHVLQVPEQFGNPVMCMMRGQAYLAGTSLGQEIDGSEQVKVLCIRSGNLLGKVGCEAASTSPTGQKEPALSSARKSDDRCRHQHTSRWRALQVRSTSSGSRFHQLLAEKISTSWKPR